MESFAAISGAGIKSANALKNSEAIYDGDVVAGSGIGNLGGKEKRASEGAAEAIEKVEYGEQYTKVNLKIADTLLNIIPEEWDKVLVYSEVREEYERMYFYYYPKDELKPIYSLDIVDYFNVNEELLEEKEMKLYKYFRELWNEFKNQEQEQWTYLTFILNSKGKMNIDYNYDNVSEISPVDKQNKWMKKYLS